MRRDIYNHIKTLAIMDQCETPSHSNQWAYELTKQALADAHITVKIEEDNDCNILAYCYTAVYPCGKEEPALLIYPEDGDIWQLCTIDDEASALELKERECFRELNHLLESLRAFGPETTLIAGISKGTVIRYIQKAKNLIEHLEGVALK